ncbi:MAG: FAD-dependent thymidylate synthase [Sphaerochaetaceae bacterium]|nr:FAD-dependent thymidylate synthase [Candidatus Cloacimonadota bacterium]
MAHCVIDEAEAILDKEFPVLDKGFVRLVDYLGSDSRIVQAARVSYGEGTKTYRQDKGLINYLMRNDHTSPFEQVSFTFHIKMPIFVARQWIRHRTAKVNEISGRYSIMADEAYIPALKDINKQSEDNKQGRSEEVLDIELQKQVAAIIEEDQQRAFETYHKLLDLGIARELARINLPLSLYTQWYWTMDLHNLFHFLKLRLDSHAQYEIRVYAQTILEIIKKVCPLATEAFEEQSLNGKRFSLKEVEGLKELIEGKELSLDGRDRVIFEEKLI